MYSHYQKVPSWKYILEDCTTSSFYVQHHSSKQLNSFCLFVFPKKHLLKNSPAPPQMAINFNFLPKYVLYSFSTSPCTFVFSTKTKIKEKGENAQRNIADRNDTLHINCRGEALISPHSFAYSLLSTQHSIISKSKPRRELWRNTVMCDNAVARCPLLADRAYNEVKRGENIGLIIHGSFVNQWRGIRPVNRLEDLFWLQNGNKGPFTTWMGQLVIKKPALKQREKEFCGSTPLTPGRTTAC